MKGLVLPQKWPIGLTSLWLAVPAGPFCLFQGSLCTCARAGGFIRRGTCGSQTRFGIPEVGEFYGATEGNVLLSNHCTSPESRGYVLAQCNTYLRCCIVLKPANPLALSACLQYRVLPMLATLVQCGHLASPCVCYALRVDVRASSEVYTSRRTSCYQLLC